MRKYLYAYSLNLQNFMQLRATLAMDRFGGLAVIATLYFFWSAMVPPGGSFLGYDRAQMLTYVLLMNLLRSFVFTGRGWDLVREIASGRVSGYLLRPIDFRGYCLALDLSQKTLHLAAAVFEVGFLILVLRAPLRLPGSAATWALFMASALLASLIYFLLEFAVASLAFWTSESAGPLFCFELFIQFAAGVFFPLDVLPPGLQRSLSATPFPSLVFFPIRIFLERASPAEALRVIGSEVIWLGLALAASGWIWRLGLETYTAEGG